MNASSLTPIDETDHTQGPDDAPVTLIEYGDFECPVCGQAYPIVERLRRDYGDDLRFAFRHLPLNKVHPHAAQAAQAAEAAGAQDQFWAMHATLFKNQRALEDDDLKRYAEDLDLDSARFAQELDDGVYNRRVQADLRGGMRAGANGTPSFFINGVRHDGDFDFDTLSQAITKAGA